jgi:hypothetical protein
LACEFEIKDLGIKYYYLGLEVWKKPGEIFLGQGNYVITILQIFGMMNCKSMATPMVTNLKKLRDFDSDLVDPSMYRQLIGSLMYLVNTRSNIFVVVNMLSQFQVESIHEHWIVAKHILRYLHGTLNYGLRYVSNSDVQLQGYTNYDLAGSADERKRTSGLCFSLGSLMIYCTSTK